MKAHLPQLPSCLLFPPCIQMWPHIWEHPLHKSQLEFVPQLKLEENLDQPFSLSELRQIKQDLGSYTDDPGKYIDTFQHIILAFDLMWKETMVIFSQISSDLEHARVLKPEVMLQGFTCQVINTQWGKLRSPPQILIGIIMTLSTSGKGIIFLVCVKAGVKSAQQKVISYTHVSAITQEPNENLIDFLEWLKEALQKFTNLDFDS